MRIALYQPDIPQNAAAVFRLAACLGVPVDVIEPCGFQMTDKSLRRVGMDYLSQVRITRHVDWQHFCAAATGRTVLLTTHGQTRYTDFAFAGGDTLLVGRESAGAPPEVHQHAAATVMVPMAPNMRSLNVVTALAMVVGEACRQTGWPHARSTGPTSSAQENIDD